jgi:hypothetical protein
MTPDHLLKTPVNPGVVPHNRAPPHEVSLLAFRTEPRLSGALEG